MPLSQTRKRVGLVLKLVWPAHATESRQKAAGMDALRTRWEIRAMGGREAAYRRLVSVVVTKAVSRVHGSASDERDGHVQDSPSGVVAPGSGLVDSLPLLAHAGRYAADRFLPYHSQT